MPAGCRRFSTAAALSSISKKELSYADFGRHESQDFWTLFLFAGYLTVGKHLGGRNCLLRIPNEEIRQTFRSRVSARFSSQNAAFAAHGIKLAEAAVTGNASRMAEVLEPLLRTYVSVRDAATRAPAVNYYPESRLMLTQSLLPEGSLPDPLH